MLFRSGKFLYPHILVDNRGEAVKITFVLFAGIDFLLICLDLFFQFPLFRFILCGQFKKPVMVDFSTYVVPINPLEEDVPLCLCLFYALNKPFKAFLRLPVNIGKIVVKFAAC